MRLYLTGFLESRIRPESQKITQKVAGKKYDDSPFTLFVFTMFVVDFPLQGVRLPQVTENSPKSCIDRRRAMHAEGKADANGQNRAFGARLLRSRWVGSRCSIISNEIPENPNKQKYANRVPNELPTPATLGSKTTLVTRCGT
jgi:hypothetical protein